VHELAAPVDATNQLGGTMLVPLLMAGLPFCSTNLVEGPVHTYGALANEVKNSRSVAICTGRGGGREREGDEERWPP
jgi:hypothetical protein